MTGLFLTDPAWYIPTILIFGVIFFPYDRFFPRDPKS